MEIREINEKCRDLRNKIMINEEILKDLKEEDKVKEYVSVLRDLKKNKQVLQNLMIQLNCKKIMNCTHLFVKTEVVNFNEENTEVYHCLKCGLTNEYQVKEVPNSRLSEMQKMMGTLYYGCSAHGDVLSDNIYSFEKAYAVYRNIIANNPRINMQTLSHTFEDVYESTYGNEEIFDQNLEIDSVVRFKNKTK